MSMICDKVSRVRNWQDSDENSIVSNCVPGTQEMRTGLMLFLTVWIGTPLIAAENDSVKASRFDVREMDTLQCIAFSPNGKLLVVGGGPWHGPGMFAVFDYPSGRLRFVNKKHRQAISAVTFSPNGSRIATGGGDGENKVWDALNGRLLADFEGHRIDTRSVCFTPDSRRLITGGGWDNSVRMWDVASARPLATFRFLFKQKAIEEGVREFPELPRERAPLSETFLVPIALLYGVALSPDGNMIAVATEEPRVRFWDPSTGKGRRILHTDHPEGVLHVTYNSDGKQLATGGIGEKDGTVRLWNLATGRKLQTFKGHRDSILQIVFSPDNKTLVTCSCFPDSTAKVWLVDTGKELATLRNRNNRYEIYKVAVAPDGKVLATVGGPNSLMFWDLKTLKEVQPWADQKEKSPAKGN